MKKSIVALITLIAVTTFSWAADPEVEVGPGLISDQLATGLFLNPTAGGQKKGVLTPQYCVSIQPLRDNYKVKHGALAVYGVTDWLEIGGQYTNSSEDPDRTSSSGGPQIRVRLLEAKEWMPEVALGGIFLFHDTEQQTVYAAASKNVGISEDGMVKQVGLNAGIRQVWLDPSAAKDTDTVGFFGAEIQGPNHLYFVGEFSTKPETAIHVPFAFGIQVRHPDGMGFSLAGLQNGTNKKIGVYVGVGINFY